MARREAGVANVFRTDLERDKMQALGIGVVWSVTRSKCKGWKI